MSKVRIIVRMLLLMLVDLLEFLNLVADTILKYIPAIFAVITSMILLVGILSLLTLEMRDLTPDKGRVTSFFLIVSSGYCTSLVLWLVNIRAWKYIAKFFKRYYDEASKK